MMGSSKVEEVSANIIHCVFPYIFSARAQSHTGQESTVA